MHGYTTYLKATATNKYKTKVEGHNGGLGAGPHWGLAVPPVRSFAPDQGVEAPEADDTLRPYIFAFVSNITNVQKSLLCQN